MAAKSIPAGAKFGRLIVTGVGEPSTEKSGARASTSICLCECGNVKQVRNGSLLQGSSQSCGCATAEAREQRCTTHGNGKRNAKTAEYKVWTGINRRVFNKNEKSFPDYGGRGITVCERWRQFENFLEDVGKRPSSGHSIDRIDSNGNYEPGNVKWSTRKEQNNNKRNNRLMTFYGKTMTLVQWSEISQVCRFVIAARLNRLGWSEKASVWTPVKRKIASAEK
jgi:hypothetical protein